MSTRPRKRQRPVTRHNITSPTPSPPKWDDTLAALISRLNGLRSQAIALRDDHLQSVAEIQNSISLSETATRATANIIPPPPSHDVDIFSWGLQASPASSPSLPCPSSTQPPMPAIKLLMEPEPPEKVIHEQSIIVRAQAINRKNAELARERLPKQPEAQRNKTLHDYFLDEAMWMATDFREERKWKIQMAKKVAKMAAQYHAQRERRKARAQIEAHEKVVRLAKSVAKDVRKFWRQIGEIAHYRSSLVEEARQQVERKAQLKHLLAKTKLYSDELASTLRNPSAAVKEKVENDHVKKVTFKEKTGYAIPDGAQHTGASDWNDDICKDEDLVESDSASDGTAAREMEIDSPTRDIPFENSLEEGVDDESTMIVAEKEQVEDPSELLTLENQASMNIDELLRSQGIDPATYKADKEQYLHETDQRSISLDEEGCAYVGESDADDESTIRAAEAEEESCPEEEMKLRGEADMSIEDLLRSQGIDPEAYFADKAKYLDDADSEPSSNDGKAEVKVDLIDTDSKPRLGISPLFPTKPQDHKVVQSNNEKSSVLSGHADQTLSNGREEPDVKMSGNCDVDLHTDSCNSVHVSISTKTSLPVGSTHQLSNDCKESSLLSKKENDLTFRDGQGGTLMPAKVSLPLQAIPCPTPSENFPSIKLPSVLLRGKLRDYQRTGMEWLISLYRQNMNGILADEMGLGKTIQTIALLAWLALEEGIWGPHLIVVPTSVIVNWEVEFKKWLPGFKILTYFGSMKERKQKRLGWTKPNLFHVCITSYTLAVQDSTILRRKKWAYLILDEAHNIKNFESQRWQTLLRFSSQRRLLLTGTPLQNSVMELWSLMHFLMPQVFSSHSEFKDWFSKPLVEAAEAEKEGSRDRAEIVSNLHNVLRPFLLRRLKADVEKGLPPKYEHVITCHLSKRQRQLYEDFMSRSDIRETLETGDFFGVMNVLMQLRKVCNHPDLFEGRPIVSPFAMSAIFYPVPSCIIGVLEKKSRHSVNNPLTSGELSSEECAWAGSWFDDEAKRISADDAMHEVLSQAERAQGSDVLYSRQDISAAGLRAKKRIDSFRRSTLRHLILLNGMRMRRRALFGEDLRRIYTLNPSSLAESCRLNRSIHDSFLPSSLSKLSRSIEDVSCLANRFSDSFVCCVKKASAPLIEMRYQGDDMSHRSDTQRLMELNKFSSSYRSLFRSYTVRSQVTIPDARLIQWDCGKLQFLDRLLRCLRIRQSRVLIFTQMTKVLDVLESFLSLHSYRYLRLDGTTKTDDRQKVVERFNTDHRIFCMILTTRAGGVGLNLTGADSVVFYDTDYNPAIDNQAQDRAHRIGQTKPVHIYRLVSEQTVEESILRRANDKRNLESIVISSAGFTTEAIRKSVAAPLSARGSAVRNDVRNGRVAEQTGHSINESSKEVTSTNILESDIDLRPRVESAGGGFCGFKNETQEQSMSRKRSSEVFEGPGGDVIGLNQYQEVTTKLLANEDERERIALYTAEQEERELRAEFEDGPVDKKLLDEKEQKSTINATGFSDIESTLSPIQLYALRLVESWNGDALEGGKLEEGAPFFHSITAEEGSPPASNVMLPEKGFHPAACDAERGTLSEEENIRNSLFYEVKTTKDGHTSYLKALTDTDVDIKLYLPLRDGGPEEFKVSSVVNGTAAAGLECAEDAAFFPHAYNRMSRTPYATHRQKVRGLANFRRRQAECEANRQREIQMSVAAAAAVSTPLVTIMKSSGDGSIAPNLRQSNGSERFKTAKKNIDLRVIGGPVPKRARVDNGPKSRQGTSGNGVNGSDAIPSSMGLFKKTGKKTNRRLSLPGGKAALATLGSSLPGEGIGLNDGWTKEEDEGLIATAAEFNNNMFLASDILSNDSRVNVGLRRHRTVRHCIDRLINSLGKDSKAGPPMPKSAIADDEVFRKHRLALQRALRDVKLKPPQWLTTLSLSTNVHSSHMKTISRAHGKMKGPIKRNVLPPFDAFLSTYEVPAHFKSGFKTTETTPQALSKIRFPFLRPPRDDARTSLQRGGGQPSRYNGSASSQGPLQGGDPTLFSKATNKASRIQTLNSGVSRVQSGQGRALKTIGSGHVTKARGTEALGKVGRSGDSSDVVQKSGRLPPSYNTGTRKGYLVPGTSGRMSIGQFGSTVQNIPKGSMLEGVDQKASSSRKGATGRVSASVAGLKAGNSGAGNGVVSKANTAHTNGLVSGIVKGIDKTSMNRSVPQSAHMGSGIATGKGISKNGVVKGNVGRGRAHNTTPKNGVGETNATVSGSNFQGRAVKGCRVASGSGLSVSTSAATILKGSGIVGSAGKVRNEITSRTIVQGSGGVSAVEKKGTIAPTVAKGQSIAKAQGIASGSRVLDGTGNNGESMIRDGEPAYKSKGSNTSTDAQKSADDKRKAQQALRES